MIVMQMYTHVKMEQQFDTYKPSWMGIFICMDYKKSGFEIWAVAKYICLAVILTIHCQNFQAFSMGQDS